MPKLSFTDTWALALLLAIPLLWWLAHKTPLSPSSGRRNLALALRTGTLGSLALALAGAQISLPVEQSSVIFLLDTSYSIAGPERERATAFVQDAFAALPSHAQAGIIGFGSSPRVLHALSSARDLPPLHSLGDGSETNIAAAVQLGLAMLPREGYRRLVLVSDGGETLGDLRRLAATLQRQGVALDILPLSGAADGLDAAIQNLSLPALTREGQQPRLVVQVDSNAAAAGELHVEANGARVASQPVQLQPGASEIALNLPTPAPGFQRYRVYLDIADDTRPANNSAEGFTAVEGPPQILLVEGQPGAGAALGQALNAAQLHTDIIAPAAMPQSLGALSAYDVLLLVNVPLHELPLGTVRVLPAYVRELGRGLAMVGGDQAFGAGGYRGSSIEELLPVKMEITNAEQHPATSIAVVMDTSGSMAQVENGSTKLRLAAEGVIRVAELLRDQDELTVIPYDTLPTGTIGPLPGQRRQEAIQAVSQTTIGTNGGGIVVRSSLQEALRYLDTSDRPIRHIILLSDGDDAEEQEGVTALTRQLNAQQITLSVVAIGTGKDLEFLERTATAGNGRYFLARHAGELPAIMAQDAQRVLRPYLVEEPLLPQQVAEHPILREISTSAPLEGYVATTARPSAQTLLISPRREPLLATWQHGLGRSAAWTSDFGSRWASGLVRQPEFPRLAAQLVSWLLPTTRDQGLTLQASVVQGQAQLALHATSADGQPRTGLEPSALLTTEDGNETALGLREVAPGQYQADAPALMPGTYQLAVEASDAQGEAVGIINAGLVVPSAAEYRWSGPAHDLLADVAALTGGRIEPAIEQLYRSEGIPRSRPQPLRQHLLGLALLLLLLEIGARRLPPDGLKVWRPPSR